MKLIFINILILISFSCKTNIKQTLKDKTSTPKMKPLYEHTDESIKVVFYNVENLFDTVDNPKTNDEEFNKGGMKYWSSWRLQKKLNQIYKTFMSLGGWDAPAIIGIAEVENRFMMSSLIYKTPLYKHNYKLVHEESNDHRGIDVALLYRPQYFKKIYHETINVKFKSNPNYHSRDILYVKGLLSAKDTLHIFVCHWPSRYGGHLETNIKRAEAALAVKMKTDSIFEHNQQSKIIILGDFNDDPNDESLVKHLQADSTVNNKKPFLYNTMYYTSLLPNIGTARHRMNWNAFDQIIVSSSLLPGEVGYTIKSKKGNIFNPDFLLEENSKYFGYRPFRTYIGMKYHGGFSDHLPVYVELVRERNPN